MVCDLRACGEEGLLGGLGRVQKVFSFRKLSRIAYSKTLKGLCRIVLPYIYIYIGSSIGAPRSLGTRPHYRRIRYLDGDSVMVS